MNVRVTWVKPYTWILKLSNPACIWWYNKTDLQVRCQGYNDLPVTPFSVAKPFAMDSHMLGGFLGGGGALKSCSFHYNSNLTESQQYMCTAMTA